MIYSSIFKDLWYSMETRQGTLERYCRNKRSDSGIAQSTKRSAKKYVIYYILSAAHRIVLSVHLYF